jgi:Fanconi anemia group I protein
VIRKALFSPKIETRRIAVNGVLTMLKHFKISSNLLSTTSTQQILSQSSSGLSQVAADVHCGKSVSHEALCLELLGVLKRGFSQQVGVRMSLYQGRLGKYSSYF